MPVPDFDRKQLSFIPLFRKTAGEVPLAYTRPLPPSSEQSKNPATGH